MKDLLRGAVENGTGKFAKSDLVEIAGKTGTSQKLVNGAYSKQDYNTSFIGYFPANDPKAVCLIYVNSPSIGKYGGLVAAPIFKNVAEKTVLANPVEFQPPENLDDVKDEVKIIYAKSSENEVKKTENPRKNTARNVMPDITGYSVREAVQLLTELGIKYRIKRDRKNYKAERNSQERQLKRILFVKLFVMVLVQVLTGWLVY
jgi:cell division protein FtsI (penicillin-binding protein 3)